MSLQHPLSNIYILHDRYLKANANKINYQLGLSKVVYLVESLTLFIVVSIRSRQPIKKKRAL